MPPARSGIRNLTEKYLERHPAEREQLKPLLAALEADAEPTSRAALPGHVTCSAVVIDRARRVLHIVHKASGKLLPPGGHVEDDRTLVAAALREVCEEAGIRPRDLCLIPQFLGAPIDVDVHDIDANPAKGELAHRHFDFRFAFYTTAEQTPPLVLQDEEVSGAQWLPFADVRSPTLRTKLLKAEADGLDGQPGIFTVYPPPDGDHATNTWSSGMSPAGFTSLGGAAVVEDPEGDVPEDPDEEEQATAPVTTTRPDTTADNVRRMENTSALAKEPTGMPPRPRRYEPGGQCQGPDELAGGQRAQPFRGPACGDTHRAADPPGCARYAHPSAPRQVNEAVRDTETCELASPKIRHPSRMVPPVTVIRSAASGCGAGPATTAASVMLYRLPWHGQLMVPSLTPTTMHPLWVQTAEKPLNSPSLGWVTTTSCSSKTLPPPTGMSEALPRTSPPGTEPSALAAPALVLGFAGR